MATAKRKHEQVNMRGLALRVDQLIDSAGVAINVSEVTGAVGGALATAAEIDRIADVSARLVTVATTPLALAVATHEGKTVVLTKTDGQAVTLPAATGSGARFRAVIGATVASSATTIKVTGNDIMVGTAHLGDSTDGTAHIWATAVDSDTITFDGSNTGGIAGTIVELEDIAADTWLVRITGDAGATEATPFSATVT